MPSLPGMLSFHPGPSKLDPAVSAAMLEACKSGLLESYHREPAFSGLYRQVWQLFVDQLALPPDYTLYLLPSATVCWHILGQSLGINSSYHLVGGAFGQRWYQLQQQYVNQVEAFLLHPRSQSTRIPLPPRDTELLCITQNETSNGSQIPGALLAERVPAIREQRPALLVALDVTSSLGGVALPWSVGDFWFASVQKCLGLPSGMAVLLCSPRAQEHILSQGIPRGPLHLPGLLAHGRTWQTPHTPNILGLALLRAVLASRPGIHEVTETIETRARGIYNLIDSHSTLSAWIQIPTNRSPTVLALTGDYSSLQSIHQRAGSVGLKLGQGYGADQDHTLRVANFPAYTAADFSRLYEVLSLDI